MLPRLFPPGIALVQTLDRRRARQRRPGLSTSQSPPGVLPPFTPSNQTLVSEFLCTRSVFLIASDGQVSRRRVPESCTPYEGSYDLGFFQQVRPSPAQPPTSSILTRSNDSHRQNSQLYDPVLGSCINSISRPLLSSTILSRAEAHPNINVSFEAKVGRVDWTHRRLYREGARGAWIEEGAEEGWDLLVGSDGNWSAVRRDMLKAQP